MSVSSGASNNNGPKNSNKEEMKQDVDINVQIIFSSMSYMKFCTEQGKELVKAEEGGKATAFHLEATQTWPEKTYAYNEGVDEVIFIDCGSDRIEQYLKNGINEKALMKYVSYGIMTLKDMLYRMTVQEKKRGNVHCLLLSLHPAQKCMFAMSALLGKVLSYGDIYSSFTVQVCSQPEYRYTFNWIYNYGWSLDVIYNAAFNPYEARVETKKSPQQRINEINSLLGNAEARYGSIASWFGGDKPRRGLWEDKGYKWVPDGYDEKGKLKYRKQEIERTKWVDENGQYWVKYEGHTYKYEELYEEWRKVTHPNDEELEQRIEDAKANKEAAKKRLDKTNDAINESVYRSMETQTQNFIKEETNNIRNIPEYANKSDHEIQAMLAEKGLIPRTNANELDDNYLFYIDGKYVTSDGITDIRDAAKQNLADAEEQLKEAEKAKRLKDDSDWLFYLNAAQVILMVPCMVVAPLALIDIGLNVAVFYFEGDMREANGQEFWDTTSGVVTGITIAIDLVSFVPLFLPKPKIKEIPVYNKKGQYIGSKLTNPDADEVVLHFKEGGDIEERIIVDDVIPETPKSPLENKLESLNNPDENFEKQWRKEIDNIINSPVKRDGVKPRKPKAAEPKATEAPAEPKNANSSEASAAAEDNPIQKLEYQSQDVKEIGDGQATVASGLENANDAVAAYKQSFLQRIGSKYDSLPDDWKPSFGNIPGADLFNMIKTGNLKQFKGWFNILVTLHFYWNAAIFIKDLDSTIAERDKNVKEHIGEIELGIDEKMSEAEIAEIINEERIREEGDYIIENAPNNQQDTIDFIYDRTNSELEAMMNGDVEFTNEDFNSMSAINESAKRAIMARENAEAVNTFVETDKQLDQMIEEKGYDFTDDEFVALLDKHTAAKNTIEKNEMQRAADDYMTTEIAMNNLPVNDENYDDIYNGLNSRNSNDWNIMQGNIDYDNYLQDPEQAKAVANAQAKGAETDLGIEILLQNDDKVRKARKEEEERKRKEEEERKRKEKEEKERQSKTTR